ncbi:MAG TPA: hypothetical protein VNE62_06420 [Actinomycetota bacterium]|nr:hypothetical protein [Actinomycetota bacterium]
MRYARLLTVPVLATLLALTPVVPSGAEDRGTVEVGPGASFTNNYPPIPATAPPAPLFAQIRPPGCRDQNRAYCDAFKMEINVPENYQEIYQVEIVLDWKKRTDTNRLNIHVWGTDDPVSGAPVAQDNTATNKPKRVLLGEPEGTLWITIVNFAGLNDGYSLTFNWKLVDLGALPPDPGSPDSAPSFSTDSPPATRGLPQAGDSFGADDSAFGGSDIKPTARTRKVLIPGPDGELRSVALPVIARGERAAASPSGLSSFTVFLIMLLLTSAAAVGFFVLKAKRHRA